MSHQEIKLGRTYDRLIKKYKLHSSIIDNYDPLTNYKCILFLSGTGITISARIDLQTNEFHHIYVEIRGESKKVKTWDQAEKFLSGKFPVN